MPFNTTFYTIRRGIAQPATIQNAYCQSNTSASDYGKCYNIIDGKAVFVQTDTSTYPVGSLPCEVDNTCERKTDITGVRVLATFFNYPGKQAIAQYIYSRSHSNLTFAGNIAFWRGHLFPAFSTEFLANAYSFLWSAHYYEPVSWPIYDPVGNWKAYLNPYTISVGRVFVLRWQGSLFTSVLYLTSFEEYNNNAWYLGDVSVVWAYESSPLAIIPLDYDRDYVPYQELRSAFGFSINGVDQPGWNADDIVRVLKELFSSRAWAVFDDRQYILYLYNLTPDYVPDWLIEKLSPTAMKVLQPPSDATVAKAWLDLLNERNAQIPPQAELP